MADRETEILAMEEKALEGLESSADGDRESFSLLSEAPSLRKGPRIGSE